MSIKSCSLFNASNVKIGVLKIIWSPVLYDTEQRMNSLGFKTKIFTIFAFCFLFDDAISECCPTVDTILYWPAMGSTCQNISGAYHYRNGICAFETCSDLTDHKDRWYCGKGDCNIFGCNCDDGCIQLDQWGLEQVSLLEKKGPVNLAGIFRVKHKQLVEKIFWSATLMLSSKFPVTGKYCTRFV